MALSCPQNINQCVVRGDPYRMSMTIVTKLEYWENPEMYRAAMVFRTHQDDNLTPLLELKATPEPVPEDEWFRPEDPQLYIEITGTPAETQGLPPYNIVAYCEFQEAAGASLGRLFNSKVKVTD